MMMGASLFWFARGLAARKYFTTRDLAGFVWQQAKFRIAGTEGSADDMHTIRENALAFVAGRPVAEIVQASEEIYDELMADRIWSGTRALAQQHLDAGQRVWLVTATPVELASIIAHRLGLTGALGTVAGGRRRQVHRPAGRRDDARPGEGRGGAGPGRARGAGPGPLHRLQRLGQRPADALAHRHGRRGQPRHRAAGGRPRARLDDPRLPDRPQGRQDRRPDGRRPRRCPAALVGGALALPAGASKFPLASWPSV